MPSANQQLEAIFNQMAKILEILEGDRFRINAFSKAARVIGELAEDLASVGSDIKALQQFEGIGKGTAERIAEYLDTGKIEDHQKLLAKIPPGLLELLDVQGLGPKKIALLWREADIESKADLKAALETDKLAKLPGMGKKTLDNLRKSLAFAESAGERVKLGTAMALATWVVQQMRQVKGVEQISYAGSLRRGKETIGDVDIIVAAKEKDRETIAEKFVRLEVVTDILGQGKTKCSVRTDQNIQVDLRMIEPDQYGAALMYFTGSKEHNVRLRERAIKQGYSLNEYALTQSDSETIVASKTEEEIYEKLDLAWIPPEMREDRGEISKAEKGKLPKLIELSDIRAELHCHTTASDGTMSIREMVMLAADLGYHTIAITDHSKGQVQAHGLDEKRLEAHIEAIREVANEFKDNIRVLAGSEVDILADGRLDYSNSLLKELDIVVASPHAALTQDSKKATERLLKAIHNPYITILGHPTGRLINRREGLSPDMKQIIAAAKERGIALEINANHYRLDLRDTHAKLAIDSGVKLAINTDAHGAADFDQLRFGVLTARRAGAEADHVINCLSQAELAKWIEKTRGG